MWWAAEANPLPIPKESLTWGNMLTHFNEIEVDFHRFFHTDFADGVLKRRPWRWFRIRIVALLGMDSDLARSLGLNNTPHVIPPPHGGL